jgi:large subunit ribosomal protein L16
MFIPKKSKFKKQQKGKFSNRIAHSVTKPKQLLFGSVGLKALFFNRLTSKQVETIRQCINKTVKKTGRIIMNTFPSIPISKKPIEVRMGKGKGNVDRWIFKVKPGFILCEIVTDQTDVAIRALNSVKKKINFKTKIIFN